MSIIQEALKKAGDRKPNSRIEKTSHNKDDDYIGSAINERLYKKYGPGHGEPIARAKKAVFFKSDLNNLGTVMLIIFILAVSFASINFLGRHEAGKMKGSREALSPKISQTEQTRPSTNLITKDEGRPVELGRKSLMQSMKPNVPELVLNGIMYLEDGPRALINNSIVEKGDTIGGAKVISINKKSVILESENNEITLNLK